MIEIEKYPCNDINEACERERYYFELSNAKLNTNCSARNDKEYRKYNRNKIQEYYEKNKNKINAMRKIPYICDICNGSILITIEQNILISKNIKPQSTIIINFYFLSIHQLNYQFRLFLIQILFAR
jgi:hypothetical protein